jgi:hypothetical protein
VTTFLEREQQIDIEKVKIEAPPEQPRGEDSEPNVEELFGLKKDDAKK